MGAPERAGRRVAVIGAGLSGLIAARTLAAAGCEVRLFDKGRAPGGRLRGAGDHPRFEVGAQYFTARDPRFAEAIATWEAAGVVARWAGRVAVWPGLEPAEGTVRYVGVPTMEALAAHLAEDLSCERGCRVEGIVEKDGLYTLHVARDPQRGTLPAAGGEVTRAAVGPFDGVLVTTPPAQAAPLLATVAPALAARAAAIPFVPCYALGFTLATPPRAPFEGLFVGRGEAPVLAWLSDAGSKPGRGGPSWIAHSSVRGAALLDALPDDDARVAAILTAAAPLLGEQHLAVTATTLRRWTHARPAGGGADPGILQAGTLLAGGDWTFAEGRVEGAFHAGHALATALLRAP